MFEEEGVVSVLKDVEKLNKTKMVNWLLVFSIIDVVVDFDKSNVSWMRKKLNWSESKSEWEEMREVGIVCRVVKRNEGVAGEGCRTG